MRRVVHAVAIALAAVILVGAMPRDAAASVRVHVDVSRQQMTVWVEGGLRHVWAVSTARRGKVTPRGVFSPQAMKVRHYSTLYNGAPMPHAIFFRGNYAIHGTVEEGRLGRPASAGCIRLARGNAATLFALVRAHGTGATRIVITG